MRSLRVATVSEGFGRDLGEGMARVATLVRQARACGVGLLVLPEAALGGYLERLDDATRLPPALRREGPELGRLAAIAGDVVVCVGLTETDGDAIYNAGACVSGEGVLGWHRKVHQPLAEDVSYAAGDGFAAFDTPVGRLGMMICYDKAFPESARSLALDGAEIVACLSAWPMSRTNPAVAMDHDRQSRQFDLHDAAGAAQNQLFWASANQFGPFGDLCFLGRAKVMGPGGERLAGTGCAADVAVADIDPPTALPRARRSLHHLRDRRPASYRVGPPAEPVTAEAVALATGPVGGAPPAG